MMLNEGCGAFNFMALGLGEHQISEINKSWCQPKQKYTIIDCSVISNALGYENQNTGDWLIID